jgi:hypothetical protein
MVTLSEDLFLLIARQFSLELPQQSLDQKLLLTYIDRLWVGSAGGSVGERFWSVLVGSGDYVGSVGSGDGPRQRIVLRANLL